MLLVGSETNEIKNKLLEFMDISCIPSIYGGQRILPGV